MLYEVTVNVLYYFFGIIYPLFRSSRIVRGKETKEAKQLVLKYW